MKHLILFSLLTFTSIFANAEVCGNTNPRLCVGDIVYTQKGVDGWANTYRALITAVSSDQKTYSVNLADFSDSYSGKSITGLGVTTENKCSATTPRICIGDTVYTIRNRDGWANTYRAKVLALSANYTKFTLQFLDYSDKHSDKTLHGLAITGPNR